MGHDRSESNFCFWIHVTFLFFLVKDGGRDVITYANEHIQTHLKTKCQGDCSWKVSFLLFDQIQNKDHSKKMLFLFLLKFDRYFNGHCWLNALHVHIHDQRVKINQNQISVFELTSLPVLTCFFFNRHVDPKLMT